MLYSTVGTEEGLEFDGLPDVAYDGFSFLLSKRVRKKNRIDTSWFPVFIVVDVVVVVDGFLEYFDLRMGVLGGQSSPVTVDLGFRKKVMEGQAVEKMKAQDDVLEIVDTKIDMAKYVDAVRDPGAGAISTFIGTTRDTFQNKEVIQLQYEAYKPMAILELKKICTSARSKWSLIGIAIAHRLGTVPIGEESVFIAVSSVHRKDSLDACQFLIDELKARVPIWKKEVYSNGEVWKENVEFVQRSQVRS
ncbi:hypothetical protein R1sor_005240 [Riccia sorocarpa]|uniref:Molybdopterin synthase catalytic subunit n=1 Tax=Riccia sorocarpa TaxID=122646 RepID=A0ABD3HMH6_9MARC